MQTYEIIVKERSVYPNSADTTLVRTSIGIDEVHILFDNDEWLDFPVQLTFGHGETLVTQTLTLAAVTSTLWAAESTCTIPWEVIQDLGSITLTFDGTDNSGNHIITAYGAPLSVVEAGEVGDGTVPEAAPTVDEYTQAYNNAVTAANDAASAANQVEEILSSTDAQTLQELLDELGDCMRYQGSVAAYADLPSGADAGDVYNVVAAYGDYPAGTNWAWTGSEWDALGGSVDLSGYATLASPALTGTPTAPTAATGTDTTQLATTAFVQQEIDANAYELPLMSADTRGGAMLGDGLTVEDGYLSSNTYYTTEEDGGDTVLVLVYDLVTE